MCIQNEFLFLKQYTTFITILVPVILTYFMQGGGKCLFFAITSLLIQLWIAQFKNGKT
jgi:fatty-acid desaturase